MGVERDLQEWLPAGMATAIPRRAAGPELDLNEVDFEELVRLGISVGQAARFISQRERRGGISSVRDVDRLYGLEPAVRDVLRARGRV